jgi:hypothetical protein
VTLLNQAAQIDRRNAMSSEVLWAHHTSDLFGESECLLTLCDSRHSLKFIGVLPSVPTICSGSPG